MGGVGGGSELLKSIPAKVGILKHTFAPCPNFTLIFLYLVVVNVYKWSILHSLCDIH